MKRRAMTLNWYCGVASSLVLNEDISITLIGNQISAVLLLNDQGGGEDASGGWQDLPDLEG